MKNFLMILLGAITIPCFAADTGSYNSKITWVKIHNSDTIYFKLESMPGDHQCSTNHFILLPALTENQRDRYYSMLLAARASAANVTVNYDKNNADCVFNRPVAHALTY